MLAATENHKPEDHAEQRHNSAHAHNGQYRGAVAGFGRVVLVTEQQNMIHRRADFPGGGVHQAEADIAGRIIDAKKIARDSAIGRQQAHTAQGADVVISLNEYLPKGNRQASAR